MRLKSRLERLERLSRALRCASCSYSLTDVPPPLPGVLPDSRPDGTILVMANCWKCGARFNVEGGSLRERQIRALFAETPPAETYRDERAAAAVAYIVRQFMLAKLRERAREPEQKAPAQAWRGYKARESPPELSRAARQRVALFKRAEAEGKAIHERLAERYGKRDFASKTFAEIETLLFDNASPEAVALDEEYERLSGATEEV
ncbi:MAG: hypothetical protein M3441_24365 [Chloroflexota bacterium]|nr:hypothetical protein [Chloroflexota bacterium]